MPTRSASSLKPVLQYNLLSFADEEFLMSIHEYFADIADELNRQSNRIRKSFASHRPSAGRNREKLVADFLRAYLPKAYGIDTGLILATTGELSNQADIV